MLSLFFGLGILLVGLWPILGQDASSEVRTESNKKEEETLPIRLKKEQCQWSRFPIGTWTETSSIAQSFEKGQPLKSITETRNALKSVEKDGYTLEQKSSVEIGNKRIEAEPALKEFDFLQQPKSPQITVRELPDAKLTIDRQVVPCKVCVYELRTPQFKQLSTIWYSETIYPYIIQTETLRTTVPTEKDTEEKILLQSQVVLLNFPSAPSIRDRLGLYQYKSIKKGGGISTVSTIFCSRLVPGSVVKEKSTESDKNGIPVRQIETNLVRFSPAPGVIMQPEIIGTGSNEILLPRRRAIVESPTYIQTE